MLGIHVNNADTKKKLSIMHIFSIDCLQQISAKWFRMIQRKASPWQGQIVHTMNEDSNDTSTSKRSKRCLHDLSLKCAQFLAFLVFFFELDVSNSAKIWLRSCRLFASQFIQIHYIAGFENSSQAATSVFPFERVKWLRFSIQVFGKWGAFHCRELSRNASNASKVSMCSMCILCYLNLFDATWNRSHFNVFLHCLVCHVCLCLLLFVLLSLLFLLFRLFAWTSLRDQIATPDSQASKSEVQKCLWLQCFRALWTPVFCVAAARCWTDGKSM